MGRACAKALRQEHVSEFPQGGQCGWFQIRGTDLKGNGEGAADCAGTCRQDKELTFGTSPMAQWLKLPMQGAHVQSLVEKRRSHILRGAAKRRK